MKYGRIVYGFNPKQTAKNQLINIGDYFQTFAVDELLKKAGVKESEIIEIERHHINDVDEEITLVLNAVFTAAKGRTSGISNDKITPVYIGYNTRSLPKASERQALVRAGTIGCRDEATYRLLDKHGYDAYLTGCMTLTMDERDNSRDYSRVYLVDVPDGIENYMPEHLKSNMVYCTQEICFNDGQRVSLGDIEAYAKNRLNEYRDHAKLMITSRLHCAGPCLAMGIPVILVRNYFDSRYAFIDKFLPCYTPDTFDAIDWNPKAVDMRAYKKMAEALFRAVLYHSPKEEALWRQIHAYLMDRDRIKYFEPLKARFYTCGLRYFPRLTLFARNRLLKRFSVIGTHLADSGQQPKR